MDVYMKTLDGFINDEDKFVTYKWLCNELDIHVNVAKQILEEYWNNHKKDGIVATIMIIGYLNNGEMRVELVKDSNLTDAINKYDKIISQHIYSLQKSLSDIQLLAGVDKCNLKHSTITCEKSVLFTDEELFSRRWGNTDMTIDTQPESRKPSIDKANDVKKSNGIGKFFKEPVGNKKVPSEGESQSKVEEKSEDKKISPPKKSTNSKKPVQSQKIGFSNLFGKVSAANQKKSLSQVNVVNNKIDKKNSSSEMEVESINENINNTNNSIEKPTIEQKKESSKEENASADKTPTNVTKDSVTIPNDESKSNKNKKTKRGAKRERSREPKVDSIKRKRILVVADSSEESAASDEEMFCDSPPHEEIIETKKSPSPPPVQNINGKRKIRKLVDKTFMDEDGYLVTKKEHVYESCSDNDNDDDDDKTKKIPEQKKIVEPPIKMVKKQTTIKNFFKKA
ncbi:hypothetical protein PV327_003033 [Microctonus hyperodae]|uniref:DNA polymerase delta subunit 3 n=1 Tax=Microctonus hyperodae TaxID=165561 RepID=A0AA39G359_MICHY|nr:hypothetical protein PV327_003033 [Microctonus hyperodae]